MYFFNGIFQKGGLLSLIFELQFVVNTKSEGAHGGEHSLDQNFVRFTK